MYATSTRREPADADAGTPSTLSRCRAPTFNHYAYIEIAQRFLPRQIILFGSYARGTPRPESDVDLLVVMRTKCPGEQSLLIRQAIECPFGLDLIVHSPQTLPRRLKLGDFFLRQIVEEDKVLYEATDR